jgi:transglutaminase/protease-like cytokinesis protein 3
MEAAEAYAKQPLRTSVMTPSEVSWALTSPFSTQKLKAWSVYVWVISNVSYDQNLYINKGLVYVTPQDVLHCRKTICDGFAQLFSVLCAEAGIETIKVVGVSKGGSNADERHAWNLAKLDGQWVEVDPTWGSSFQSNFYFAADPELFKYTHYAFDAKQQLSKVRLTRAEFDVQDGLRGGEDPFWRRWHNRADSGEFKRFDLRLR